MSTDLADLADDPEGVPDSSILYRRVSWQGAGGRQKYAGQACPMHPNFFSDQTEERARAFGLAGRCMSVGLHAVLVEHDHNSARMLEGWDDYGLVSVTAGELRNLKKLNGDPIPQGVMRHPTDDEPWHAVVFAMDGGVRSNAGKAAISACAKWVIDLRP